MHDAPQRAHDLAVSSGSSKVGERTASRGQHFVKIARLESSLRRTQRAQNWRARIRGGVGMRKAVRQQQLFSFLGVIRVRYGKKSCTTHSSPLGMVAKPQDTPLYLRSVMFT